MSVTWPMMVPTFARSSVNFMQPMMGGTSPRERIRSRTKRSGARVPERSSGPPMGSTVRSVAGMTFMAKVK